MKRSTTMIGLAGILAAPVLALAQVPERPVRQGLDPAQVEAQLQARAQARQEAQAGAQNGGLQQRRGGGGQNRAGRGAGQADAGAFAGQPGGFQGGGAIPVAAAPASNANQSAGSPLASSPATAQKNGDPLNGLGGKVSAVLDITTAPRLLITETAFGVSDTTDLTIGQEYRDGWRLTAVNPASITMKKGEEQRQIALNFNTGAGRGPIGASAAAGGAGGGTPGQALPGRGGAVSFSNGGGAAAGRDGLPAGAGGIPTIGLGQLAINPAQMQQLQGQIRSAMANLPPELANDPRAAAALSALQSGNIGDLVAQFQGVLGGGGAGAPGSVLLRLGPNGGLPAPAP